MSDRKIRAALCTIRLDEAKQARLAAAFAPAAVFFFEPEDEAGIARVLEEIDVALLDGDLTDQVLDAPGLKWVHCNMAGLTRSARPEVFERGIALTGAAGRSAPSLAEHVFFFALSHVYDAPRLLDAQRERDWGRFAAQYARSRGLSSMTMGIVGLGNTGAAVAKRAKAFDMHVLAYTRSERSGCPEHVDGLYCADKGDAIDEHLRRSDFIALCCNLSDETYHMIGDAQFALMKPTACLINMARGAVVDERALYRALTEGRIARACSDVFEAEPLPADSPFWNLPNMMITPHATPRVRDMQGSALDILLENVRHYRNGEPMRNRMTPRDVFTR